MLRNALLLVASVSLLLPSAIGNHPQPAHGDVIVFDHKTGNEWWVEVTLSGGASGSVVTVEAMDTNGPWVALTKRSWGAWANSFHIEPGHLVQFRASWSGGEQVVSCWFTHPAGAERCDSPPPPGPFDAQFTNVKGNDWWVEVRVTANQVVATVDARIDCGTDWRPLTLRSWGAWASSFRIPAGSKVDFRARSTSGETDLSGGYIWPQATPTSGCGQSPPPAPFRAEFRNVRGNLHWAETDVAANQPVANVQLRMDGGPWRTMVKQSWGSWARSGEYFSMPRVEFRATATDGSVDTSYQGWLWAEPPQLYPSGGRNVPVAFHEYGGDLSSLRVNTFSLHRLVQVQWRTNSQDWTPMAMDPDGSWVATTQRLPTGQWVEFMATWIDPGTQQPVSASSGATTWPPWPQSGGFAEYDFRYEVDFHNGDFKLREGRVNFTFVAGGPGASNWGTWRGHYESTCTYTHSEYVASTDTWTNTTETRSGGFAPYGPRATSIAAREQVYITFWGCDNALLWTRVAERMPYTTEVRYPWGTRVVADTWHGVDYAEAAQANAGADFDVWWETNTGLTVAWRVDTPHPDADIHNTGHIVGSSALDG